MCGRYTIETQFLADLLGDVAPDLLAAMKTGEIRPTDAVPVLEDDSDVRLMRWGFPRRDGKGVVINTRSETALQKALFSESLLQRRVAIPTGGYYEWRREGGRPREKYLFRRSGETALFLAGMYAYFTGPDGAPAPRFVILTTAANASVASYHDRMPVLLAQDECAAWLSGEAMRDVLERVPVPLTATSAEVPQDEQTTLF